MSQNNEYQPIQNSPINRQSRMENGLQTHLKQKQKTYLLAT